MSTARENTAMIRILIVDDSADVRDGLRYILGFHGDLEVVGEARHGLEAISRVAELHPDLVLMDAQMPEMDGVEATHFVKDHKPDVKVLFMTVLQEFKEAAIDAGADAFLSKFSPRQELVEAIRRLGRAA